MKNAVKSFQTAWHFLVLMGKLALLLTWTMTRILEKLCRVFNVLMESVFTK